MPLPGVTVKRVEIGGRAVEGVGISNLIAIGMTEKGPLNTPTLITSYNQFQRIFGRNVIWSHFDNAIQQFFDQVGNAPCYVFRVAGATASKAQTTILGTDGTTNSLKITAKSEGTWGNRIAVRVENLGVGSGTKVRFVVKYEGEEVEKWEVVKYDDNQLKRISENSEYVDFEWMNEIDPQDGTYTLSEGDDGLNITDADIIGEYDPTTGKRTGIKALETLEEIGILIAPGIYSLTVLNELIALAERKRHFLIIDPPPAQTPDEVKEFRNSLPATAFAGLYYPYLLAFDSADQLTKPFAPSGAVAGAFVKTDTEIGIWKAPANIVLKNILGVEYTLDDAQTQVLTENRVNCIRFFKGKGIKVWGARTLSESTNFMYVPVSRVFSYVEATIKKNFDWVVFEPWSPTLEASVKASLRAWLYTEWQKGMFVGDEDTAFQVMVGVGDGLQTEVEAKMGKLRVRVLINPPSPVEEAIFEVGPIPVDVLLSK